MSAAIYLFSSKIMNSNKQFTFNKEKHEYLLDGKRMTGCTTILGVLAKPALIQWASDMAVGQFGWIKDKEWVEEDGKLKKIVVPKELRLEKAKEGLDKIMKLDLEGFLVALDEARVAHCKRKEKAGEWGTKTHEEISNFINWWIKFNTGKGPGKPQKWSESVIRFMKWGEENKVRFLDTEKIIYSESLFVGGIIDFVCEIDGELWYGDIKTSKSGLYAENNWQMGGYQLLFEDMGIYVNPKGYVLLNIKEDGSFEEKRTVSTEEHKKAFLACLEIYRLKEKGNNQLL